MQASLIKGKPKSKSNIEVNFDHIITKCKALGLNNKVPEFLQTKARRSFTTGLNLWHGLQYLNAYTLSRHKLNIEQIIPRIQKGKIDVYSMLNNFVTFLQKETPNGHDMMARTVITYVAAARSYLQYADIDLPTKKFQNRVTMPTLYKEDAAAMDANDVREILNHCNNRRLKAYLLVLASSGMRATEALAIREQDINWNGINFADLTDVTEPATVRVRKEYSKTRAERSIFISNEAARHLNSWLEWKYRAHPEVRHQGTSKSDLVFGRLRIDDEAAQQERQHPSRLYKKIQHQFRYTLEQAKHATKKDDGILKRRLVTFHSFRRFVKTTIANQNRNSDFSEWFLGHTKSPYYTTKPEELRRIYKEDCMKYLTFLDYPTVEATGKSFEAQVKGLERENDLLKAKLRHVEVTKDERLAYLEEQIKAINERLVHRVSNQVALEDTEVEGSKQWSKQERKQFEDVMTNTEDYMIDDDD